VNLLQQILTPPDITLNSLTFQTETPTDNFIPYVFTPEHAVDMGQDVSSLVMSQDGEVMKFIHYPAKIAGEPPDQITIEKSPTAVLMISNDGQHCSAAYRQDPAENRR
jgi:hypothetical protein